MSAPDAQPLRRRGGPGETRGEGKKAGKTTKPISFSAPGRGEDKERKGHLKIKSVIKICLVLLLVLPIPLFVLFTYLVSPDDYPVPYILPRPPKLEVNNLLSEAERLFEGEILAPEAFVFRDEALYTGTVDGKIVRIMNEKLTTVMDLQQFCGGAGHAACSRPLGLGFDLTAKPSNFIVCDALLGLLRIKPTREVITLLPVGHVVDGRPLTFLNHLDVAKDGVIYFSQSTDYGHSEIFKEMLSGRGTGRLLRHDPSQNKTDVLIDGLRLANGVALSKDESFVLVADSFNARILKYHLKGDKEGETEVFVDNLPCIPDNLRLTKSGGFWTGSGFPRYEENNFNPIDFFGPRPWLRQILLWLPVEKLMSISPSGSILVELDEQGEIVRTLMDRDGKTVRMTSDVIDLDGVLYIGSYAEPYIARLDTRKS